MHIVCTCRRARNIPYYTETEESLLCCIAVTNHKNLYNCLKSLNVHLIAKLALPCWQFKVNSCCIQLRSVIPSSGVARFNNLLIDSRAKCKHTYEGTYINICIHT